MKINDWVNCFETEIKLIKNFYLPVRSTVLSLNNGDGVMISPIDFSVADWAYIQAKLQIRHIVAPCDLHHLFVQTAKDQLGQAKLWSTKELAHKRSDIAWDQQVLPKNWTMSEEIELIPILGGNTHEVAFYHKKSKTLVVTDLIFNLENRKGLLSWMMLHLFGTWNRPAVSRLFKSSIKDKKEFRVSAVKLLGLDFETLIMAHGNIITENAKGILLNALRERNLI
ncbi:MAG: DUF4336 domain-containing protein [Bdellovibrionota bacterium]